VKNTEERIPLRAGPWSLLYENGDLRNLRLAGRLAVLRVYAAVRDEDWGTVPAALRVHEREIRSDGFCIRYEAEHRQGSIHFVWQGLLTGDANGVITFSLDGEAKTTFRRNRIGFCLLHPAACAGDHCTIKHTEGTVSETRLPECIAPEQPVPPFAEMRGLTQEIGDGWQVGFQFAGDTFEMEDQRNWTDASYKTFCTPLHLPHPVTVAAGTRIQQQVTIRAERCREDAPRLVSIFPTADPSVPVMLTRVGESLPLPAWGLGVPYHRAALTEEQRELLRPLRLSHLRAELRLTEQESGWEEMLFRAATDARSLDIPLEITLLLPSEDESIRRDILHRLRTRLDAWRPAVVRWLALPGRENLRTPPPYPALLADARACLADYAPGAPFAAGTSHDFIFANRFRPPAATGDALTFALNPQTHAFDDASLIETLSTQATVVRSARCIAAGRPIVVSPVTLRPRGNPYAAEPVPWTPPPADPRQRTLFGAAWTLGSLKYLAESGAASLTYYETTGPGGVLDERGVFPLYFVLALIGEFAGGSIVPGRSSDPLAAEVLFLTQGKRRRTLVANLSDTVQTVTVGGQDAWTRIRHLDEAGSPTICREPSALLADGGETIGAENGTLSLSLSPYAVAVLDAVPTGTGTEARRT
jgi:D-apionolactonase